MKFLDYFNGAVRTQNIAIGLNLYLSSQSICIMGFGFPTKGDPMLGSPGTLLFPQTLFFSSLNHYLSFVEWLLSSLPILFRIANPLFLIHFSYL